MWRGLGSASQKAVCVDGPGTSRTHAAEPVADCRPSSARHYIWQLGWEKYMKITYFCLFFECIFELAQFVARKLGQGLQASPGHERSKTVVKNGLRGIDDSDLTKERRPVKYLRYHISEISLCPPFLLCLGAGTREEREGIDQEQAPLGWYLLWAVGEPP